MNKFTRDPSHEHEHKPQLIADFASAGYRIAYSVSPKPATEPAREDRRTLRSPSEKESVSSRFAAVFRQASSFPTSKQRRGVKAGCRRGGEEEEGRGGEETLNARFTNFWRVGKLRIAGLGFVIVG
uniref:Uncharacterized protein n=1 Tax=Ficus carica TaxID=3494 RepID=A0AA88CR73_FICCA|nr:hypothetical protein TIFTF001_050506 [Ficus carica]